MARTKITQTRTRKIMIVTKQEQEKLVEKYINEKHSLDKCEGFIDGLRAGLELIDKKMIDENKN